MTNSKSIAGLLGPFLVLLSITETINIRIFATPTEAALQNLAPVSYLSGCLIFFAGLYIVRSHNVWTAGWPVAVTLVGWMLLLAGAFRMIAPELARSDVESNAAVYGTGIVLLLLGLFLSYKAYARS